MTILKIDSSITGDASVSRQLIAAVTEQFKRPIPTRRWSSAISSRPRFPT